MLAKQRVHGLEGLGEGACRIQGKDALDLALAERGVRQIDRFELVGSTRIRAASLAGNAQQRPVRPGAD
jgi:hypothetical protein